MSVELRWVHTNPDECDCGTVHPIGYKAKCYQELFCKWGKFENSEANPKNGLRHLMLVTGDYIQRLLFDGSRPSPRGGIHSASTDGDRIFAHVDADGTRTTWELFEAHWSDGGGLSADIYVGRWPD